MGEVIELRPNTKTNSADVIEMMEIFLEYFLCLNNILEDRHKMAELHRVGGCDALQAIAKLSLKAHPQCLLAFLDTQ